MHQLKELKRLQKMNQRLCRAVSSLTLDKLILSEAAKSLSLTATCHCHYNLGLIYRNGKGVSQDYKAAVKSCRLAAEQGELMPKEIWVLCMTSVRSTKDYVYAHMWENLLPLMGLRLVVSCETSLLNEMTPST